jgi:cardiolipin synthase
VVDRLLVIAGVIVCWHFELLPRWGLAILVARELAVVVLAQVGMSRGKDLEINWPGRLSVWPLMSGLFFALCGVNVLDELLFLTGLGLSLIAFAMYVRDGLRKTAPTPSS